MACQWSLVMNCDIQCVNFCVNLSYITKNFGLLEVIKKGLNVHVLEFAFMRLDLSHTHTHTACNIVVICHDIKKKILTHPIPSHRMPVPILPEILPFPFKVASGARSLEIYIPLVTNDVGNLR